MESAASAWYPTAQWSKAGAPAGFDWVGGAAQNIDPVAAMFNEAWMQQSLHMQVAALQAVGFAVGGIHAWLYLKGRAPDLNLKALRIAMLLGATASLIQPFAGHWAGERVAKLQPALLGACHFWYRRRPTFPRWYLWALVGATPLGMIAIEAGWIVSQVDDPDRGDSVHRFSPPWATDLAPLRYSHPDPRRAGVIRSDPFSAGPSSRAPEG